MPFRCLSFYPLQSPLTHTQTHPHNHGRITLTSSHSILHTIAFSISLSHTYSLLLEGSKLNKLSVDRKGHRSEMSVGQMYVKQMRGFIKYPRMVVLNEYTVLVRSIH